jgi:excisionase family DNA binding protein
MKPQRQQPAEQTAEAVLGFSPEGAARSTGLTTTGIYAALKRGELAGRKIGRRTVIEASELQRWLRSFPPVKRSSARPDAQPDAQSGARA